MHEVTLVYYIHLNMNRTKRVLYELDVKISLLDRVPSTVTRTSVHAENTRHVKFKVITLVFGVVTSLSVV